MVTQVTTVRKGLRVHFFNLAHIWHIMRTVKDPWIWDLEYEGFVTSQVQKTQRKLFWRVFTSQKVFVRSWKVFLSQKLNFQTGNPVRWNNPLRNLLRLGNQRLEVVMNWKHHFRAPKSTCLYFSALKTLQDSFFCEKLGWKLGFRLKNDGILDIKTMGSLTASKCPICVPS